MCKDSGGEEILTANITILCQMSCHDFTITFPQRGAEFFFIVKS